MPGQGRSAVTKQLPVTARDHPAGVSDQSLDRVTSRGRLPLVPVGRTDTEKDLGDFLLGRTVTMTIESAEQPARTRSLLPGHAGVRRYGAAMQPCEQPLDRLDPIQPVNAERHLCDGGRGAVVDNLKKLTVAEVETQMGFTIDGP